MIGRQDYKWPENFNFAVWTGLSVSKIAKKWTSMLAEDSGMSIHIICTPTSVANRFKLVRFGIADITDGIPAEVNQVLQGDHKTGCAERDTGAFQLRAVWAGSKVNAGFMVRGDSEIRDIYDIKRGIRIIDMNRIDTEGLLAWAGIKDPKDDVVWVKATSPEEKIRLILSGEADVAWAIPSAPSTDKAERNPRGIRWLDLNSATDPEGAIRFRKRNTLVEFGPMFEGVPSCLAHWGTMGTGLFCCRNDANPEFIYHLTKWLDKSYPRYKDLHSRLKHMSLKTLIEQLDTTFIPCHDGLIKYLKELGMWTLAHEKRQKQNEELVTRYCEASKEAMWLADDREIVVSSNNPAWIELWETYKNGHGLSDFNFLPSLEKSKSS